MSLSQSMCDIKIYLRLTYFVSELGYGGGYGGYGGYGGHHHHHHHG